MMKQKEAVFNAICAVRGTTSFTDPVELTKEERQEISTSLLADFRAGNIEYSGDVNDPKLSAYVSGLISNWLRKDRRLNGNTTYVPANPGSRVGSGDESIKAMKSLLNATDDEEAREEIQAAIDARLAELRPKPKVEINVDALPESLRHLAPQKS